MDCILDICLTDSRWDEIASREDLVQYGSSIVRENLIIEPALDETGFKKSLATKLELYYSSHSISETERLVNALKSSAIDQKDPDKQYIVISGNKLAVRVPDFEDDNLGYIDNLGKYLRWASTILGMKDPEIKFIKDPAVGKGIQLTAKVERMFDNTLAAMTLVSTESGDKAEFKTGFKANLVELLAAARLLRRYGGAIQKAKAPKGQKSVQVTLDDLKKSINGRSGLNEKGVSDFSGIFVKAIFNELTKPNSKKFPGVWLHSLKSTNGVKQNIGIIYKLGYESKVVNAQKVLQVIHHAAVLKDSEVPLQYHNVVDSKPTHRFRSLGELSKTQKDKLPVLPKQTNKNSEIVKIPEKIRFPESITHQEFRLGALLLLPLIDPKDAKSPKDQISTDPLSVRDKNVLAFYSKHRGIVDGLNLAYATKTAVGKKNSKATVLGYRSARGHVLRSTANIEWQDRAGNKYSALSEVPQHVREFLLKLLHRSIGDEDSESENDSEDEEEAFQTSSEKQSPKKE
jgi:hypothetical protein